MKYYVLLISISCSIYAVKKHLLPNVTKNSHYYRAEQKILKRQPINHRRKVKPLLLAAALKRLEAMNYPNSINDEKLLQQALNTDESELLDPMAVFILHTIPVITDAYEANLEKKEMEWNQEKSALNTRERRNKFLFIGGSTVMLIIGYLLNGCVC